MSRHVIVLACAISVLSACSIWAEPVSAPNGSFESGGETPDGWTPQGGARWARVDAPEGARYVTVTGADGGQWRSSPVAFEPGTTYELRLKYRYRPEGTAGGACAVVGPAFAIRVLPLAAIDGAPWQEFRMRFSVPGTAEAAECALTLGQWQLQGAIDYDALELYRVKLSHTSRQGVTMGEGESIAGDQYRFAAPLQAQRTISRPLAGYSADFHDNRWRFASGEDYVVYRQEVSGRKQLRAKVKPTVWFHGKSSLKLAVEASVDGAQYRLIGTVGQQDGAAGFDVPADMLPAESVWIRLRCDATDTAEPLFFQCTGYEYEATLDAPGPDGAGATSFATILAEDDGLVVEPEATGPTSGAFSIQVRNDRNVGVQITPTLEVTADGGEAASFSVPAQSLAAGEVARLVIPYETPRPGHYSLQLTLGPGLQTRLSTETMVCVLDAQGYGERLPSPDPDVAVWRASCGWKVSRERPVPVAEATGVKLAVACNETEGVQLVLRPERALRGLTAAVGELRTEAGEPLPTSATELLKVEYVAVEEVSDEIGCTGQWPDPLPPLTGPIDLPAGLNQPLWVNVRVPQDARPGLYHGAVTLRAEGFEARVPLEVRVYGFALPQDTTCRSLLGFSPGNVMRYHNLKAEADKRLVLGKYLQSFADHRISPYNPAPLDGFDYTWQAGGLWEGGKVVAEGAHGGAHCLQAEDSSASSAPQAVYRDAIALSGEPLRLRAWYRTSDEQPALALLSFYDAAGQHVSGRNHHVELAGSTQWRLCEATSGKPPEDAVTAKLSFLGCQWTPEGEKMGTVWVDDISLEDTGTGQELLQNGDLEQAPSLQGDLVRFDWSRWDGAMARAMDRYHFGSFLLSVPGLGGGTFYERSLGSLCGYEQGTPEHEALFSAWCSAVREHLAAGGLLGKAVVYPFDEPDEKDYAFVVDQLRLLGKHFPGLQRMVPMNLGAAESFIGHIDRWCPLMSTHSPRFAAERKRAGDLYTWYICCSPKAPHIANFIDRPATDMRVWLWQTWQEQVDGVLIWETTWWTSGAAYPDTPQDPYSDSMSWVDGYGTPTGEKRRWNVGDGRFLYPPRAATGTQTEAVLDGPVTSVRWEALRDGMEDFEYLALLRSRLNAARGRLSAEDVAKYEALLSVPPDISKSLVQYTQDPAPLERRRAEVAAAIEAIGP